MISSTTLYPCMYLDFTSSSTGVRLIDLLDAGLVGGQFFLCKTIYFSPSLYSLNHAEGVGAIVTCITDSYHLSYIHSGIKYFLRM